MKMTKIALALGVAATLATGVASAHQAGDVLVRAGGVLVVPNVKNSNAAVSALDLDVNANAQLGLTATYMITDNFAVELLGASPFSHEITVLGGTKVGKVKHLPPSLYAQYYFGDKNSKARPYIGAGVNYTTFFNEKGTNGVTDLKLKDSWGLILNAGLDINVTENFFVNGAIHFAKIKSEATFKLGGTPIKNDVTLDPAVVFLGVGYRF